MQKLWSLKGKRFAKQLLFENWVYTSSPEEGKITQKKMLEIEVQSS